MRDMENHVIRLMFSTTAQWLRTVRLFQEERSLDLKCLIFYARYIRRSIGASAASSAQNPRAFRSGSKRMETTPFRMPADPAQYWLRYSCASSIRWARPPGELFSVIDDE